jgi:hypothetical protein
MSDIRCSATLRLDFRLKFHFRVYSDRNWPKDMGLVYLFPESPLLLGVCVKISLIGAICKDQFDTYRGTSIKGDALLDEAACTLHMQHL